MISKNPVEERDSESTTTIKNNVEMTGNIKKVIMKVRLSAIFIILLVLSFILHKANVFVINDFALKILGAGRIEESFISYPTNISYYPDDIIEKLTLIDITQKNSYNHYIYKTPGLDVYTEGRKLNETADEAEALHTYGTYGIFKNVYVNGLSTFGSKTQYVLPDNSSEWFSIRRFTRFNGTLRYYFDEMVVIGNQHTRENYGHFYNDLLLPMMLIPEEVRRNVYVMGYNRSNYHHEGLIAIGFNPSMIIDIEEDDWMFVKRLHTVIKPVPFLFYFGICGRRIHQTFYNYFHLDAIENNRYVFCNRNKGLWRHLENMDDVVQEARKSFPMINWEIMEDVFPTMRETALNWATIKLIFLPTGSNCVKCVYMKPNSVMVVGLAGKIDLSIMCDITCCELFNIWFAVPGMTHFGEKDAKNYVDVPFAIRTLKCGIYASFHKKWPASFDGFFL